MLKTTMNKIVLIKLREKKKYNQSTTLTLQQLVALNKSMRQNFKERKKKKIMHEKLDESIER